MARKYDVISPDGFSINREGTYSSKKKAREGFTEWAKNFERQGYYSSNRGRIPLDELADHCQLIPVQDEMDNEENIEIGAF
jgi:hypothetical protein